jgi:GTP-dependent phosphoenolpyruvate carboxykinase
LPEQPVADDLAWIDVDVDGRPDLVVAAQGHLTVAEVDP